ncbi:hypothetical protein GTQ40_15845 [Flavobacteriaceae bacterium R38]|nr:hypothetical protein [Flavobacteriaceae bacterium R38]
MIQKEVTNKKATNEKKNNSNWFSKIKKEVIIIGFLIIIIIAGAIISFQTISEKNEIIRVAQEEKQIIEDERARIAFIKDAIAQLVEKEQEHLHLIASTTADQVTKQNANLLYKTNSANLIDQVNEKLTPEDYHKFDGNSLMNYARHLEMNGDSDKAKTLLEYVIKETEDDLTLSYAYRSLATLYAQNNSSFFSAERSRDYRKREIAIAKDAPQGDLRYLKLIDLYETWAIDEYTHLKNIENGNKLMDTAFYCINRLPDYSPLKADVDKRVRSTYNFYNNILIPENITGNYRYYVNNQGIGDAFITINESQGSIRIDYNSEGKLVGQLNGTGGFVDFETLKFEVQTESYSSVFKTQKNTTGTLELKTQKGKLLDGILNEYGKKPVAVKLAKQED